MPQFFVDCECKTGITLTLDGPDAHHIVKVLRLKMGDWLILSNGKGKSFKVQILETKSRSVTVEILEELLTHLDRPYPTLALSIIKLERFEWAIQKAVELGCRRILPLITKRTVNFRLNSFKRKIERWHKIANEAAKQSGLPFHPGISPILPFENLCTNFSSFDPVVIFYEGAERESISDFWKKRKGHVCQNHVEKPLLIIGPEGGFTSDEYELAKKSGACAVGLGKQILKSETAGVIAIGIWQYELGNMDL